MSKTTRTLKAIGSVVGLAALGSCVVAAGVAEADDRVRRNRHEREHLLADARRLERESERLEARADEYSRLARRMYTSAMRRECEAKAASLQEEADIAACDARRLRRRAEAL